jgi:hypothetical protein
MSASALGREGRTFLCPGLGHRRWSAHARAKAVDYIRRERGSHGSRVREERRLLRCEACFVGCSFSWDGSLERSGRGSAGWAGVGRGPAGSATTDAIAPCDPGFGQTLAGRAPSRAAAALFRSAGCRACRVAGSGRDPVGSGEFCAVVCV